MDTKQTRRGSRQRIKKKKKRAGYVKGRYRKADGGRQRTALMKEGKEVDAEDQIERQSGSAARRGAAWRMESEAGGGGGGTHLAGAKACQTERSKSGYGGGVGVVGGGGGGDGVGGSTTSLFPVTTAAASQQQQRQKQQ
ncbi:hypothetical protein PUN28_010179 [Cardiocondyla obscurior]|uniref:Uncharacterized protein n=1 Tax=Cardiocondyla obscurior TaxID=286306 RepID=A0AAW2FPG1_9HYME